ncbi:hypothetical protein [Cyanothece sp. BG0011]|uniref:hypothetical protein n=1 Tax=Cyanothece sp. BG0011 TaxID=2082950 RepID=UPI000D1D6DE3|nr:hypothetical protein [Cyanothece sp. BG0011]
MLNLNYGKSGMASAIALLMGITALSPFFSFKPATAQLLPRPSQPSSPSMNYGNTSVTIPAGTRIPMQFQNGERILVSPEETLPITLQTAATIRDSNRNVLIPAGSDVNGEIRPVRGGSQFFAREIIVDGQRYPFNATSRVVSRTETIRQGANIGEILGGTVAGAGAAAIIAGVTGDRRIDALEVLAGAAVGTLAGWGLPEAGIIGGGEATVIAIEPEQDFLLTLQSSFSIASNSNYQNTRYPLSFR